MTQIEGYQWHCTWTSHMGCLKAASDYLGLKHSLPWLFGGTGHAFIMCFHDTGCASGPTAWRTERLFELGHNLGYAVSGVSGGKWEEDFGDRQKRAHATLKHALEKGLPCYGWELDVPEYYCIHGCDDISYYYTGPTAPEKQGSKIWAELGQTDIGILEVYYLERCEGAELNMQVKEGLEFALEYATGPAKWIYPGYSSGRKAYDAWIKAIESPSSDLVGLSYNASVWHECRNFAVKFLEEARERLGIHPVLFDEALGCYREVEKQLDHVRHIYPFPTPDEHVPDKGKAIEALTLARCAEEKGLDVLAQLVSVLL